MYIYEDHTCRHDGCKEYCFKRSSFEMLVWPAVFCAKVHQVDCYITVTRVFTRYSLNHIFPCVLRFIFTRRE